MDTRERAITPEHFDEAFRKKDLSDLDITIKRLQMTTSDFAICYKGKILALIERKTWKDLAATIKDVKRRLNYKKMLKAKEENPTCMSVIYLIEGAFITNRNQKIQRIPYSTLRSHLDHLMYNHNIHCVYSRNKSDTAYRLLELTKNIINMTKKEENRLKQIDEMLKLDNIKSTKEDNEDEKEAKIGAAELLTRKIVLPDQLIVQGIISAIKGISDTMSTMLTDNDITLSRLILGEYSYADIAGIRYPGGKAIQVSQAKKIIKKYTDIASLNLSADNASPEQEKNMIKMLAAVPGISQKTARVILNEITIKELIVVRGDSDNDDDEARTQLREAEQKISTKLELFDSKIENRIAKIKMTKKRKVGPAIAAKLIYFFNYNKNLDDDGRRKT